MAKKRNKKWILIVLGLVILLGFYYTIGFSVDRPGSAYNKGHNAIWLGHEWVDVHKSPSQIQQLVSTLSRHDIDTVFVHSGPIGEDGNIDPSRYEFAQNFLHEARIASSDISYQAWLGQIRSKIDLADEGVRDNIAEQAIWLTEEVGFDGIHLDIEPVWDEDSDFILLLKEVDEAVEEHPVSVALAEFMPSTVVWLSKGFHEFKNYNTQKNYKNVAKYADQIVVMAYDTGLDRDWYMWLVKEQTIWLTDLLDGTELFVGIPSYEEVKEGFDPEAENVESGLEGIINGLNNIRSDKDNFAGVAIYSFWETDPDEWEVYEKLWQ